VRSEKEKKYDTDLRRRIDAAMAEIREQQIKAKEPYGKIGQMLYGVCLEILEKHLGD
jgi:hypothetical protein